MSHAGKAKVHTNIFEKAKIGEQNNLIMGNKYAVADPGFEVRGAHFFVN